MKEVELAKEHWGTKHESDEFLKWKTDRFNAFKHRFEKDPPKTMLDIGCGFAYEAEFFQKEFGTKLWLLDADIDECDRSKKLIAQNLVTSMAGVHNNAKSFAFYHTIERLKKSFDERGLDYTFVDANNIELPEDLKFDLIYSSKSCGYHYPVNTYKDLILKHSHEDTKVLLDCKRRLITKAATRKPPLFVDVDPACLDEKLSYYKDKKSCLLDIKFL